MSTHTATTLPPEDEYCISRPDAMSIYDCGADQDMQISATYPRPYGGNTPILAIEIIDARDEDIPTIAARLREIAEHLPEMHRQFAAERDRRVTAVIETARSMRTTLHGAHLCPSDQQAVMRAFDTMSESFEPDEVSW